jgi:SAM-dependent methyltransferase
VVGSSDTSSACDQATLDFYDKEAASYAASHRGGINRWLSDFMQMLPEGGRILELGCGSGRDAEALLAHGFDVDPTDGTPAMAAQAEERLQRPVKVMRFDELADVGLFDGVWAHASLLHVPRTTLGTVLARVFRSLKPGGVLFANYKSGEAAGRDQFDRYYNYPDRRMLIGTYLTSEKWEILSAVNYAGGSYGGGDASWIAITARKPLL